MKEKDDYVVKFRLLLGDASLGELRFHLHKQNLGVRWPERWELDVDGCYAVCFLYHSRSKEQLTSGSPNVGLTDIEQETIPSTVPNSMTTVTIQRETKDKRYKDNENIPKTVKGCRDDHAKKHSNKV